MAVAAELMTLLRDRRGSVEILTLNRPDRRNALDAALIAALSTALGECEEDPAIHAVILTGAGDRAFCAGMDLKAFAAQKADAPTADLTHFNAFTEGTYPLPVIGAANATAVAGGFELLLNCDIVVASENAKFGIPEVKRGLFAAGGGTTLPARIPLAIALELGLTGDLITAERAAFLGLVNRVVAPDQVIPTALELGARIGENGPLGVLATKKLMRVTYREGVAASRAAQEQESPIVFGSEDALEGARAADNFELSKIRSPGEDCDLVADGVSLARAAGACTGPPQARCPMTNGTGRGNQCPHILGQGLQDVTLQGVEVIAAILPDSQQASLHEDFDVVRDRRLRDGECGQEDGGSQLLDVGGLADDAPSHRIA
jgi:enoyl-CoA hydratase